METPPNFGGVSTFGRLRSTYRLGRLLLRHLRLHSHDRSADLDRARLGCLGHFVTPWTESMPLSRLAPTTFNSSRRSGRARLPFSRKISDHPAARPPAGVPAIPGLRVVRFVCSSSS